MIAEMTSPIVAAVDFNPEELKEFRDLKPAIYSKFTSVTTEQDQTYFQSVRADPLEYLLKRYRKKKWTVLLKDRNNVLKSANYRHHTADYYDIPLSAWSTNYYKRFVKYSGLVKRGHLEDRVLNSYRPKTVSRQDQDQLKSILERETWIHKMAISGELLYDTKYCALARVLETMYLTKVVRNVPFRFKRMEFSSVISKDDYLLYDYFEPHMHLFYCCNRWKDDQASLRVRSYLEKSITGYDSHLKTVNLFLNYNSCSGLWPGLRGSNFDQNIGFFDSRVKTYRNQQGRVTSLERLEAFNRFELVYVSSPADADKIHDQLLNNIQEYLIYLRIGFDTLKTGAWFDQSRQVDECYTVDFECPVGDKLIEVGNLSRNADHYTSCYDITVKNQPAVNGCSGMGIQRLVYLFLLYNSVEPEKWPAEIADSYRKLLSEEVF